MGLGVPDAVQFNIQALTFQVNILPQAFALPMQTVGLSQAFISVHQLYIGMTVSDSRIADARLRL